eukprot:1384101-Pyramimonas_sp.AAC.1
MRADTAASRCLPGAGRGPRLAPEGGVRESGGPGSSDRREAPSSTGMIDRLCLAMGLAVGGPDGPPRSPSTA